MYSPLSITETSPLLPLLSLVTLLGLPFLGLAYRLLYQAHKGNQAAKASRNWHMTSGKVLATQIGSRRPNRVLHLGIKMYYPVIMYEYSVNGHTYMGNRIAFGNKIGFRNKKWAVKKLTNYTAGRIVSVYYNPVSPADAVLERSAPDNKMLIGFALFHIFIYITLVIGLISAAPA